MNGAKPAWRHKLLWPIVGWAMVVAVLVLSLIPLTVDLSEGRDKVSHFVAYGSLMFWFGMLYPGWRLESIAAIGFALMGVGVEYLQRWTGYRTFDVNDMIANGIGFLLGWILVQTPLRKVLYWVDARLRG